MGIKKTDPTTNTELNEASTRWAFNFKRKDMPKDVKLSTINQANNDKEGSQSLNERLKSGKMVAAATDW